jgi:hypothetical protein
MYLGINFRRTEQLIVNENDAIQYPMNRGRAPFITSLYFDCVVLDIPISASIR